MKKVREVIAYKNYFEAFLKGLPEKAQNKIFKIIEAIETFERVPANYLKYIKGTEGLFEARAKLGSDTWRVFCFFDDGKLVILLNGFTKKTQKTPKKEIAKAERLMKEYYKEKRRQL
ncbi:MAG: type II toxin-antitoxin system RelE/ParE family toxin [Bacteroidales bacterium]|jgi:phage-related protein|nr:type II toxin-antitoxin system RelE/ParE family toxin [Bacteroidales bacterium]